MCVGNRHRAENLKFSSSYMYVLSLVRSRSRSFHLISSRPAIWKLQDNICRVVCWCCGGAAAGALVLLLLRECVKNGVRCRRGRRRRYSNANQITSNIQIEEKQSKRNSRDQPTTAAERQRDPRRKRGQRKSLTIIINTHIYTLEIIKIK